MAQTGYTTQISKGGGFTSYIRFYFSTTYDAPTNTSTVSIKPQVKVTANYGSDLRFYSNAASGAGVYGNGTNRYSVGGNYGGDNTLRTSSNPNGTFVNMNPYSGSISTFTVTHDRNGKATFTAGMVGAVIEMYSNTKSTYNNKTGASGEFTEPAPYKITYHDDYGSGAPAAQSIYATFSYNLSTTIPVRTGYDFLGWATSPTTTAAQYQPGASVTPNGNLNLYAVWKASGSVRIDDGEQFKQYLVYIDNGDQFKQCVPYIDNGTEWKIYT